MSADKNNKIENANSLRARYDAWLMTKPVVVREILGWLEVIVVALVLAWLITSFIIINATVPTGSMENTIMPGDRLFGLRLTYYFSSPKRGDIAVFKYPVNECLLSKLNDKTGKEFIKKYNSVSDDKIRHVNYIKRVIGLPGETVEIRDGKVYIDGSDEPLDEPYLKEEWIRKNDGITFHVPEGCYLMMGDNRNNSNDARYWTHNAELLFNMAKDYGCDVAVTEEELEALSYVPKKNMLGKAYVRYWPLNKISLIK